MLFLQSAFFLSASLLTLSAYTSNNSQLKIEPRKSALVISVEKAEWGEARIEDIKAVLYSAGSELTTFFPSKQLNPIIVGHREPHPRVLYKRGSNGEYTVLLSAEERRWAQFAYQFSHELSHILSNYENTKESQNNWFDEALSETASLFTLRRMAVTWKTNAPYSGWKNYASALREYADGAMSESYRQLPPDITFIQWFRDNRSILKQDQTLGEKEELIANMLLPLFERNPDNWEAICYLNLGKPASESFEEHLSSWHRHAPSKHRKFIEDVGNLFGVRVLPSKNK